MREIKTMVWIQFIALLFNFVGAILFACTVIKSKKEIAKLAGGIPTFGPGHSESKKEVFNKDRIIGISGLILLIIGFFLQLIYLIIVEII